MTDQEVRQPLKIDLGPSLRPSPEEIARRKALGEEARKLREEIGPIGISVTDLIRELREGEEYGEDE